jgi:hypothetical protein
MNSFKVGDLVAIKEGCLMLNEEPAYGTIVADGANLKYYTPQECDRLGYDYPRTGWWSVLWSRGIDAGRVSDASECLIEKVNFF